MELSADLLPILQWNRGDPRLIAWEEAFLAGMVRHIETLHGDGGRQFALLCYQTPLSLGPSRQDRPALRAATTVARQRIRSPDFGWWRKSNGGPDVGVMEPCYSR